MKFANKITVLLLSIVLISIIFISSFVYISNIDTLQNEISERLKEDAFHIMDKIDRGFFERYSDIQIIAQDKIIRSHDSTPKEITERLLDFRNTYKVYSSLSFFDLNRIRIADTAGLHLGEKHDLTPYWEDVLNGRISAASDIRVAEELNVPVIYFASPVKDENGVIFGAIVARMPSSRLYDIVKTVELVEETNFEINLINKEGLLLYSNHNPKGILENKLSSHLQMINLQITPVGIMEHFTTVNKEKALMAFSRQQGHLDFKGNEWTLLIHLPLEIALAPAIELRNIILFVSLFISIIVTLISLYFSRKFTKPIGELSKAAKELEKGNFKV
jgi:hypothetical protein